MAVLAREGYENNFFIQIHYTLQFNRKTVYNIWPHK